MPSHPRPRRGIATPGIGKTRAVVFPFDLFGSAGAAAGADLIGDELEEILADNERERSPTRAAAYQSHVEIERFSFEEMQDYERWRETGRRRVARSLAAGEFLIWIGGNHLAALPIYDELGPDALVVQLDAHLDIHHFSDTTRALSHGNFLRHCVAPFPPVVNVGHRELLLRPEDVRDFYTDVIPAEGLAVDLPAARTRLQAHGSRAARLFLDIDCDVFDPAYFPAVTQPVPFGLSPHQILSMISAVAMDKLAGVAISEFDPGRDRNDQGLSTVMWLIEYLLLRRYERSGERPA